MRRIAFAVGTLAAAGAAGVLPALAADQTVFARDARFTPGTVALRPGETLTIRHDDGLVLHDLQFADEPSRRQEAGTGWTVTRTFGSSEARQEPYRFFCSRHYGMSGRVYVNAGGTIPTSGSPPPPPPPPPGAPPPGGSPPPPPPGSTPVADLRAVTVAGRCGRRCVRLRIDLSAPAGVRGTLRRRAPGTRRFKRFGAVRFGQVDAGPRELSLERTTTGRRLRPGRYRFTLTAAGETRTLTFRVRGQ